MAYLMLSGGKLIFGGAYAIGITAQLNLPLANTWYTMPFLEVIGPCNDIIVYPSPIGAFEVEQKGLYFVNYSTSFGGSNNSTFAFQIGDTTSTPMYPTTQSWGQIKSANDVICLQGCGVLEMAAHQMCCMWVLCETANGRYMSPRCTSMNLLRIG